MEIDLTNNNLKITELEPFINTVRTKLKSLNLKGNHLGKTGVSCFIKRFDTLKDYGINLTYLNLSGNKIGDKGGSIFVKDCLN